MPNAAGWSGAPTAGLARKFLRVLTRESFRVIASPGDGGRRRLRSGWREAASCQEGGDYLGRSARRRAGVVWRVGVVFDTQLDLLGDLVAGDLADQGQGHVDAGGDAGRRDVLAVEDVALVAGFGAQAG